MQHLAGRVVGHELLHHEPGPRGEIPDGLLKGRAQACGGEPLRSDVIAEEVTVSKQEIPIEVALRRRGRPVVDAREFRVVPKLPGHRRGHLRPRFAAAALDRDHDEPRGRPVAQLIDQQRLQLRRLVREERRHVGQVMRAGDDPDRGGDAAQPGRQDSPHGVPSLVRGLQGHHRAVAVRLPNLDLKQVIFLALDPDLRHQLSPCRRRAARAPAPNAPRCPRTAGETPARARRGPPPAWRGCLRRRARPRVVVELEHAPAPAAHEGEFVAVHQEILGARLRGAFLQPVGCVVYQLSRATPPASSGATGNAVRRTASLHGACRTASAGRPRDRPRRRKVMPPKTARQRILERRVTSSYPARARARSRRN